MTSDEINSVWQNACALMKEALSEISYETWIGALKLQGVIDDRFLFMADNDFQRNMVNNRYRPMIINALKSVTKQEYGVEIYLEDEVVPQTTPTAAEPAAELLTAPVLNPKYTFDTFVIGNSNRFAHAASLAVAESPADAYNPLFLYGGVGLGKTHLMHAIGHFILRENPSAKLVYITSENFTNELISAIQNNRNTEFRNKFRNVDVLMVDDIQFIAGRDSTQEEFFHTFNELHSARKQIIISSDKPPKEIPTLEERLRSRFEWGLIADIQKPDYETRIAILRKKALAEHITVPDEIIAYIAEKVESNIRELEGTLTHVIAYSSLSGKPISMTSAEEALHNLLPVRDPKRITPELITRIVSDYYGIDPADIKSSKRSRAIALPRQIAMYMTREMTNMSLPRIGESFGGRDHTTVMHACDKINQLADSDPAFKRQLDDVKKAVNES